MTARTVAGGTKLGTRPRRRMPEARPHQIRQAALEVFARAGLHRATMDDVARRAGISKGTIYLYYRNKRELFSAVVTGKLQEILAGATGVGIPRREASAVARLRAAAANLYRFFHTPEYLGLFRIVVGEVSAFPKEAEFFYREVVLRSSRRFAAIIQDGIGRGEFRPGDPLIAARGFIGMFWIFGVSQGVLGGARIHPFDEATVLRTLTDAYFRGLATPAARRRGGRG